MKPPVQSRIYISFLIGMFLYITLTSCSQEDESGNILTEHDLIFVRESGYTLEVMRRMANLAYNQATNDLVRYYA